MSEQYAIEIRNLSKEFRTGWRRASFIRSFIDRFSEKEGRDSIIHALKGINFFVNKGETYGILGPNASGKTTLLKIIAGIIDVTEGQVLVDGKIIAFLQLGLGFQDELTALENIYLHSAFLGMDKREIDHKLEKIIEFSELGDFLNMKLKYFSAGMRLRLAFSTVIQSTIDIMMFDEILAVGDIYFREKCLKVFEKFKNEGRTIIFVSQDLKNIQKMCQRALLLDKGKQIAEGDVGMVIERYEFLRKTTN